MVEVELCKFQRDLGLSFSVLSAIHESERRCGSVSASPIFLGTFGDLLKRRLSPSVTVKTPLPDPNFPDADSLADGSALSTRTGDC